MLCLYIAYGMQCMDSNTISECIALLSALINSTENKSIPEYL
jgi:hypothetical protein